MILLGLAAFLGVLPPPAPTSASPTLEALEKECAAGKGSSCTTAGLRYQNADGVGRDLSRAAALFQRACDARDARGCIYAADAYAHGDGVAGDVARASSLYGRAASLLEPECRHGGAHACYVLALLYRYGQGVAGDERRSAQLFDQACRGGDKDACAARAGRRGGTTVTRPSPIRPPPRP